MQVLATHGALGLSNEAWIGSGRITDHLDTMLREVRTRPATVDGADHEPRIEALQAVAQTLLLLDRSDDAADFFERCLKDSPLQSRPALRARSCLIAGLQALHSNQLRTAWGCLQRAMLTKEAPQSVVVQACGALATLYFRLGMRRPAGAAVERALALLGPDAGQHRMARAVLHGLQVEFVALDLLRQHERLHDLAFWPRHEEKAGSRTSVPQLQALIADCRRQAAPFGFVAARLDFLDTLVQVAYETSGADGAAMAHIDRLAGVGLQCHAHAARHELALACIAGRRTERLRQLMLVYAGAGRARCGQQHNIEHDYCQAKLGELTGRDDAYIAHYRQYAVQSLVHLRQTCAYITVPSTVRQPADEIPKDDIASRLQGRYRRAYQYILANLHREDLSIRHVADEIGVTERALQLAFRAALGLSPSAVIRQCRMDRIRDELSNDTVTGDSTTLEVGRRWGLRSRSALSQAYKAAFGELPSETQGMALT
jgi:AraC-like DNA-binding protein